MLALVGDTVEGSRLSKILEVAQAFDLDLDVNAALCLLRQIVPAVAMLHQNARDVSHGALAPERILVTPNARVVLVEYVLAVPRSSRWPTAGSGCGRTCASRCRRARARRA